MKKETKKLLMVLFIALIMFSSSAIFILFSVIPGGSQQTASESNIPETYVVDGRLNEQTANRLLSQGYTLMEWHYYTGCCPDLQTFIDALPGELQYQIVVQKISDASSTTWASAHSLRGDTPWNVSASSDLLPPLCDILLKPPIECGLAKFGNRSAS